MKKEKTTSTMHRMPTDLHEALTSTPEVKAAWEDITLLARNEWICWITSAKKPETRRHRIERTCDDLMKGKRRPCCWPGCPHREPKAKKNL
jgi:uncharacterized protein YdeI (YjbR/CyaY-like superfamily)